MALVERRCADSSPRRSACDDRRLEDGCGESRVELLERSWCDLDTITPAAFADTDNSPAVLAAAESCGWASRSADDSGPGVVFDGCTSKLLCRPRDLATVNLPATSPVCSKSLLPAHFDVLLRFTPWLMALGSSESFSLAELLLASSLTLCRADTLRPRCCLWDDNVLGFTSPFSLCEEWSLPSALWYLACSQPINQLAYQPFIKSINQVISKSIN